MSGTAPAARPASNIALNPIQWMATDDGGLDPSIAPAPEQLLALVHDAGFDGVMAAVPEGWSVERYRDAVRAAGLALAPGYFSCRSDGRDGAEAEVLESAAIVARQHAELGLRDVGLGMGMDASRVARPALGHAADASRLSALIDLIGKIANVMGAEGVRPALHPHVGTWVETEDEARAVLDALPADELGLLPDTGHLAWAGADVRAIVRGYAARVPFIHVKDCRLDIAEQARQAGWNYAETVLAGLWVEPGRGDLPLTDIVDALPAEFDGWLMVEVDRPDIADPFESAVTSARWMRAAFGTSA